MIEIATDILEDEILRRWPVALDFTSSSDIDWTRSIKEIDAQLYKKYGLSEDEIKFIEDKIKSME